MEHPSRPGRQRQLKRPRILVVGAAAVLAVGLAIGTALGSDANTDYALAQSRYGDQPDCPQGRVLGITTWQEQQQLIARFSAQQWRVEDPTAGWPQLDQYEIAPADPAPFLQEGEEIPATMTLTVVCVPISPDTLKLLPGSGGYVPSATMEEMSR